MPEAGAVLDPNKPPGLLVCAPPSENELVVWGCDEAGAPKVKELLVCPAGCAAVDAPKSPPVVVDPKRLGVDAGCVVDAPPKRGLA